MNQVMGIKDVQYNKVPSVYNVSSQEYVIFKHRITSRWHLSVSLSIQNTVVQDDRSSIDLVLLKIENSIKNRSLLNTIESG